MAFRKPVRLGHYVHIHSDHMAQLYRRDFIQGDTLALSAMFQRHFILDGEIACRGGIVITVNKALHAVADVDADDPIVQTVFYRYNAHIIGHDTFLRYDNDHQHRGHVDAYHMHRFDWRAQRELPGSPTWIGSEAWPTLSEFICQVETWYYENREGLPDPEAVPEFGRRSGVRRSADEAEDA